MADFEFKAPSTKRANIQRIVTIVVCALLIIILIWAIVRHFQKTSNEEPAKVPDSSQNNGVSSGSSTPSAPTDNSGSASDQTASGDSKKKNTGDQQATKLTDTGPGDVAAVFIVATIAGGAGYQLYMRRRLSHEN